MYYVCIVRAYMCMDYARLQHNRPTCGAKWRLIRPQKQSATNSKHKSKHQFEKGIKTQIQNTNLKHKFKTQIQNVRARKKGKTLSLGVRAIGMY